MAEGFRVTEDGQYRVTESLDTRITQQFAPLYAQTSLTAVATLLNASDLKINLSRSFSAVGNVYIEPEFIFNGNLMLQTVGSVTAAPTLNVVAYCSLSSSVVFQAYPQVFLAVASLSGGTGVINAVGGLIFPAITNLNSSGILNGSADMIINAIVTQDINRRITESGDLRIVDNGEFRGMPGSLNIVEGRISVTVSTTPFAGKIFAHRNGQYREVIPRVKRNGNWVRPKVYAKNNGTWKRVY